MVIALDKNKRPLGFITERRFRKLCEQKRAVIYRVYPCIAIIKDIDSREIDGLSTFRIKIDPGSKHTGIAIICNETDKVMLYMQIEHRGDIVHKHKQTQKGARRSRRTRETRYRKPGFKKGQEYTSAREEGWLPPSVKSTADNIISWVRRLKRWIRITECSFEAVRFDTQLMNDPNIKGIEYQHGELFGYEMKEYLLDKYGHECQYCHGESGDKRLEWEHKLPKSRKGSNSIKNATLACKTCNDEKDALTPKEWLDTLDKNSDDKLTAARIKGIQNVIDDKNPTSDRYCAWVNSTRRYIEKALFEIFGDVECSSGGKTKYNRIKVLDLPKDHHYDALCVGTVPKNGYTDLTNGYVLYVKAMGRGSRLLGNINECGIITTKFKDNAKTYNGFMTGDIVKANVPEKYKHHGKMTGRIAIRKTGSFDIWPIEGKRCNVKSCFCKSLQKKDGYSYKYTAL